MGQDLRYNRDGWAGVIVVLVEMGGSSVVVPDRKGWAGDIWYRR
jgi:hypothetical protein